MNKRKSNHVTMRVYLIYSYYTASNLVWAAGLAYWTYDIWFVWAYNPQTVGEFVTTLFKVATVILWIILVIKITSDYLRAEQDAWSDFFRGGF